MKPTTDNRHAQAAVLETNGLAAAGKRQEFLTGPQVRDRYQKSHVTIWRWINDPALGFPQPIRINRLNYWRLADLETWEAAQENQNAA